MPEETRVDRLVRRVKDTPVLAKVIFVGLVLVLVGEVTESIDKIWSFVEKRAMQESKSTDSRDAGSPEVQPNLVGSSVRLPVDLNVLVFNAASDPEAHNFFVGDFLHEYPGLQLSSRSHWAQRYEMESSMILFQGQQNKGYAHQLAEWFPGQQEVQDYQKDPGGFFGFSSDRDLIVFIGNDWPIIRRILRGDRPTPGLQRTLGLAPKCTLRPRR